jgi:hypothetical protein
VSATTPQTAAVTTAAARWVDFMIFLSLIGVFQTCGGFAALRVVQLLPSQADLH